MCVTNLYGLSPVKQLSFHFHRLNLLNPKINFNLLKKMESSPHPPNPYNKVKGWKFWSYTILGWPLPSGIEQPLQSLHYEKQLVECHSSSFLNCKPAPELKLRNRLEGHQFLRIKGFWIHRDWKLVWNQTRCESSVFLAALAHAALHSFTAAVVLNRHRNIWTCRTPRTVTPWDTKDASWNILTKIWGSVCHEFQSFQSTHNIFCPHRNIMV